MEVYLFVLGNKAILELYPGSASSCESYFSMVCGIFICKSTCFEDIFARPRVVLPFHQKIQLLFRGKNEKSHMVMKAFHLLHLIYNISKAITVFFIFKYTTSNLCFRGNVRSNSPYTIPRLPLVLHGS